MKKTLLFGGLLMLAANQLEAATLEVANFENLSLPVNSYWCGTLDEEDEEMGFGTSWFSSGSFEFNNFYWPEYYTWAFFGYSSRTEKTFNTVTPDQFNSITGGGADGSDIFGIAFPASYLGNAVMTVGDGVTPVEIPGMQIVNTAWVVDCILKGDGYEGPFVTGDWMKLILTGYVGDEKTETVEYYLADYTSDDPSKHYFLDEWTWIDLSKLGEVTDVYFSIDSSKSNAYGVTTPTYVCIDNVGEEMRESGLNAITESAFNLNLIPGSKHIAVSGAKGKCTFIITDLSGKILSTGETSDSNSIIDISGMSSGMYIVSVSNSGISKCLKIAI